MSNLIWEDHDALLPTAPGMSTGIVATETTAQCRVCLRTATSSSTFQVVTEINFAPDEGGRRFLTYRRCAACRQARRHPDTEETPDA